MADLFETSNSVVYVAFSNDEKVTIYSLGENIRKHLEENPPGVPNWCKHDRDALTIPQVCKPFENGGHFLDLQLKQINKYNKALEKAFGQTFFEIFEIDLTGDYLNKEQVRERMQEMRNQKLEYKLLK